MCCACRSLVRIRKAEGGGAVTDRLDELYRPQIEQFGITLEEAGDALTGAVSDERARTAIAWFEERSRAERAAGTREQARLVRAAERLVAMRMDEMLTLDELARALLTSRTRLCAVFRQETGESLGAYIRRSKMERARQLLERGGLSVSEVARGVGYPRVSSFTVAFERAFGMPPSAIGE